MPSLLEREVEAFNEGVRTGDWSALVALFAEDDSKWTFFEGNYREYEEDKRERLGEEGARPHRPRYKPLMQ